MIRLWRLRSASLPVGDAPLGVGSGDAAVLARDTQGVHGFIGPE